jgi:LysR family nitrogen assimilation transcriptional regulator
VELRQLRYYVAILDHGSLSRAARVLHVAQPALTQQLRQLEEELGTQLLHRTAQGMLATDAGKVFYEHAQAILKQVGDAKSAVAHSAEKPAGAVTVGLPQSISGALALPLLKAVRASYPDINSIAILQSAILAGMGATILPVAPLLDEIERGAMRAIPIAEPAITRTVTLCASKNIPLTNAGLAVSRLIVDVTAELCAGGRWLGAHSLLPE